MTLHDVAFRKNPTKRKGAIKIRDLRLNKVTRGYMRIFEYISTLLRSAFEREFRVRLLDTVHNKALSAPRTSPPLYPILRLRCHLQASRLRHDEVESTCLSERNRLSINSDGAHRTPDGTTCALARPCKCKSIRWFDDLGTRSNGRTEVEWKFLDTRRKFRRDKTGSARESQCIHIAAPAANAELVCPSGNKISRKPEGKSESRYR